MSGLKLRGRAVAVAAISAIILPVGIAAATSAAAAGGPLDILGSTTGNSIATGPLGTVTSLVPLGSVTSLLGGAGNPTQIVSGALANPTGAATSLVPTVTKSLPLDVTKSLPLGDVTKSLPLGDLTKSLPLDVTKLLPSEIAKLIPANHPALRTPSARAVDSVNLGRGMSATTHVLPHTGGDANATALLMCAGLAVAGAGVTLVTRRKNGLALHAAS